MRVAHLAHLSSIGAGGPPLRPRSRPSKVWRMRKARGVICLLVLLARPALAQSPVDAGASTESARSFIERGVQLRKAGADREALAAFERARALEDSAEVLAQIALAEQALGRWVEAEEHLARALNLPGEDAWISKHRPSLETALREVQARLGMLEVSCNVAGAELRLDGRALGHTPLAQPVRLMAGESVIQISAPGYFEVTRLVQVDAGNLSRVEVVLIPRPSPSGDRQGTVRAEPPGTELPARELLQEARRGARTPVADSGPTRNSASSVLMYTSLGLAVAGVALGTTGYVMRETNVRLYNDDSRCSTTLGVRRSQECPSEAAAWHRGEVLAIAGFSAAAAFGSAALVLWLEQPRAPKQSSFGCMPGAASVFCQGRF